jgi:hypothetical protein
MAIASQQLMNHSPMAEEEPGEILASAEEMLLHSGEGATANVRSVANIPSLGRRLAYPG